MAAQKIVDIFTETRVAQGSLASKIGYAVKRGTEKGTCAIATAGVGIGVLCNLVGTTASVMRLGKAFVVAKGDGTPIVDGDELTPDSSAKFVKAVSGDIVLARACDGCTTDGAQIQAEFLGAYVKP